MPVSGHRWGSGPAVPGKEVMGFSKTGGVLGGGDGRQRRRRGWEGRGFEEANLNSTAPRGTDLGLALSHELGCGQILLPTHPP